MFKLREKTKKETNETTSEAAYEAPDGERAVYNETRQHIKRGARELAL